ncbi:MAG: hypothetical protein AABW47_04685 [Nanoarchaeota archaeon]
MGLFNKKDKKEVRGEGIPRLPDIPQLPELPRLPEFADTDEYSNEKLAKLPGLSNNFERNNFSQYNIKNAVTGEKEVEEDADDFAIRSEMQTMQNPPIKEKDFSSIQERPRTKEAEPLFIRIDKFEDGSRAFEGVKKQIIEVEKLFNDLKKVKENEEKEIRLFESEIKQIKDKLEGIDRNIFSKV